MKTKMEKQHLLESSNPKIEKPDYLKRAGGAFFTLVGSVGSVVTSPLILIGGLVGAFTGAVSDQPLTETGLLGLKIGSLGSIPLTLYGIELLGATVKLPSVPIENVENTSVGQIDVSYEVKVVDVPSAPKISDEAKDHTREEKKDRTAAIKIIDPYKATQPIDFNNPLEIKAFISRVKELVIVEEAKAVILKDPTDSQPVRDSALIELSSHLKNLTTEIHFWSVLNQMTRQEIRVFVGGLSTAKEGGRFSSSEVDFLWRHISLVDFEPHLKENKLRQFQVLFAGLTDEQLKASLQSADFLKIFSKEEYLDALANVAKARQLEFVASDFSRHKMLDTMIKKFKPNLFVLGKLIAIMPYATTTVRVSLINWIAHLPYEASFNIELSRLADYYIELNRQDYKRHLIASVQHSNPGRYPSTWVPGAVLRQQESESELQANNSF